MSRKRKHHKKEHTLCWDCQRACCGCSWSRHFIPVEGWTATPRKLLVTSGEHTKRVDTYCVKACPLFIPDKPRK